MGQANSAIECCGPCSIDAKGIRGGEDAISIEDNRFGSKQGEKGASSKDTPATPKAGETTDSAEVAGSRPTSAVKNFSFRNMTRQDYFCLYDAIHNLVRQDEISKEDENVLYDLIGRQDKALAGCYQRYKDLGDPTILMEPLKGRSSSGKVRGRSVR